MVKPRYYQTELELFQDPDERIKHEGAIELMKGALISVLDGETLQAAWNISHLSPEERYKLRVACRILILEAAKPDRIHPS